MKYYLFFSNMLPYVLGFMAMFVIVAIRHINNTLNYKLFAYKKDDSGSLEFESEGKTNEEEKGINDSITAVSEALKRIEKQDEIIKRIQRHNETLYRTFMQLQQLQFRNQQYTNKPAISVFDDPYLKHLDFSSSAYVYNTETGDPSPSSDVTARHFNTPVQFYGGGPAYPVRMNKIKINKKDHE